ncbi:MAG: YlxR family protein [Microlunatus sp.]
MRQPVGVPVRTCVGCRQRVAKRDLLRIVWRMTGPLVDPDQVEPGRGVYLHRDETCLRLAIKRGAVGRALRLPPGQGIGADAVTAAVLAELSPASTRTGPG